MVCTSTRSVFLSSVERTPQVVERIGEMAVVGRDVVAGDLGAQRDRPAGHGAGEVDLGADDPAGLEEVPELGVLLRRPIAEPLVELQVEELDVEVQRLGAGGRPAASSPGRGRVVPPL